VIARFFYPGNKYEPKGFILTAVLVAHCRNANRGFAVCARHNPRTL
jgi:hypothetical protein